MCTCTRTSTMYMHMDAYMNMYMYMLLTFSFSLKRGKTFRTTPDETNNADRTKWNSNSISKSTARETFVSEVITNQLQIWGIGGEQDIHI